MLRAKDENPFERYDLDPRDGIAAITQRLKELAEDATSDEERERIRAAWEELTLHPARRLRAALFAHPETRAPWGTPPSFPRRRPTAEQSPEPLAQLDLHEIAVRPSLHTSLPFTEKTDVLDELPSLEDDPIL